jgi:hypothetical protein
MIVTSQAYLRAKISSLEKTCGKGGSDTRRHTSFLHVERGKNFGGISYSAMTKIGTRFKERIRGDERLRGEIRRLGDKLSHVKG